MFVCFFVFFIYMYVRSCHVSGGESPAPHLLRPGFDPGPLHVGFVLNEMNDIRIRLLPNTSILSSHYHSTNTPYSLTTDSMYRGADKSLARPTSRCILFDGENISFYASLVIYINSTNIPPIMIINSIYENQNLLSL